MPFPFRGSSLPSAMIDSILQPLFGAVKSFPSPFVSGINTQWCTFFQTHYEGIFQRRSCMELWNNYQINKRVQHSCNSSNRVILFLGVSNLTASFPCCYAGPPVHITDRAQPLHTKISFFQILFHLKSFLFFVLENQEMEETIQDVVRPG
jgi:hypothetical protein